MAVVTTALVVASAASSIIGAFGASSAAKARARAARRQAALQRQQAARLIEMNQLNRFKAARDAEEFKATQITGFVHSGVDVTSGSALQVLADTEAQVIFNDFVSDSEAKYKASQIIAGAQSLESSAKSMDKQAKFAMGAGLLQGIASAALMSGKVGFGSSTPPTGSAGTSGVGMGSMRGTNVA
jgi:hypothetical protein